MKKSGADAVNGILSINRIRLTRINMFILCIYECTRKFQKARQHIPRAQPDSVQLGVSGDIFFKTCVGRGRNRHQGETQDVLRTSQHVEQGLHSGGVAVTEQQRIAIVELSMNLSRFFRFSGDGSVRQVGESHGVGIGDD